jgi:hypothetical protein
MRGKAGAKMKLECYATDIRGHYEDSLPKLFFFLDWARWIPTPVHVVSYEEGAGGKKVRVRRFCDHTYYHHFQITFGFGSYGLHINIEYRPFKYTPKQVMVYSDILKHERERTEYTRQYL